MKTILIRQIPAAENAGAPLTYALLRSKRRLAGMGRRTVYGLRVEAADTGERAVVRDVSSRRAFALEVMNRLIDGRVTPVHFVDTVLDSLP